MDYKPLSMPPPGLARSPTPNMSPDRWFDGNMVRWENGAVRPFGGFERLNIQDFASIARASHEWRDGENVLWTAYLCDGHLYAVNGSEVYDVSPEVPLVPPSEGFLAGGYGDDKYGEGKYGTPRAERPGVKRIGPAFTVSNFGYTLLAMSSVDGRLLQWDPSEPTAKAKKVTNSPLGRCFVVTPQRHVMVFGAEAGDTFRWCDSENIENWNLADTQSEAGEFQVQPTAPIISAINVPAGVLFASTVGWYLARYIGLPYIYNWDPVSVGSVPTSHACVVAINEGAMWVSGDRFFQFNGSTVVPIACTLSDWLRETVDANTVRFRAAGVRLGENIPEVWWFFTTPNSPENEVMIGYNYIEDWWTKGSFGRSCGHPASYTSYPTMCKGTKAYIHESGTFYGDTKELPWIETGPFNMRRGAVMAMVRRVLLDVGAKVSAAISYSQFRAKGRGQSKLMTVDGRGVIEPRVSGRDFRLRVGTVTNGDPAWTFGEAMVDIAPRGNRANQ